MNRICLYLVLVLLISGCKKNHSPVITDISSTPASGAAGTIFTLKAVASDEDGDDLTYLWQANEGIFTTMTNIREVKWKSPVSSAGITNTITVVVSDGENEVSRDLQIALGEPERGSIEGQVNYTNFKIPISGVTVRMGDQSTDTDESGHFILTGIPAFDDTLFAVKQDYTAVKSVIRIKANDTLNVALEMTSVNYTTKVSGIVSDQDGKVLEYAQVLILNPDGTESKLKATTNASGYYRLWYVPHGLQTIIARKPTTDDFTFVESKQEIDFQDVEYQLDIGLKRLNLRGQFTDPRDNRVYQYKTIGNVTWMVENLAYLPKVSPPDKISAKDAYCYVYGYSGSDTAAAKATDNYKTYGALYNLPAARAVCPEGWHLSTNAEWDDLEKFLGPSPAKQLKSISGWIQRGNGTNSSGFSALPAGCVAYNGTFQGLGESTDFATGSFFSYIFAYKGLVYGFDEVWTFSSDGSIGTSVRCTRD